MPDLTTLSPEIVAEIVDAAREQIKPWGGDEASFTHCAYAFVSNYQSYVALDSKYDAGTTRSEIIGLLQERKFYGTEAELGAVLTIARSITEAWRLVVDELHDRAGQATDSPHPTLITAGGEELIDPPSPELYELAAQVIGNRNFIPALVSPPGSGKRYLLEDLSTLLRTRTDANRLPSYVFVPQPSLGTLATQFSTALESLTTTSVIIVRDLDELAELGTAQPDFDLLTEIWKSIRNPHAKLVTSINTPFNHKLREWTPALAASLSHVQPPIPTADDLRRIATRRLKTWPIAERVEFAPDAFDIAFAEPTPHDTLVHPGLALNRLILAASRAELEGTTTVTTAHFGPGVATDNVPAKTLAARLRSRVKGQDAAIDTVAAKLAITTMGLDLKPERPNGVFLFVGPTGVGKTELARELAVQQFGGPEHLIRLDMSEYSHPSEVARLTGAPPGFKGSDQPDGWLTTRVAANPRSVVLLDEVEKADKTVWNTFLQVFDAGRLTDGRGQTADFSQTIIIMTSNLGVREATQRRTGFGTELAQAAPDTAVIMETVRKEIAPELINRLDNIVVFRPLETSALEEIAAGELARLNERLKVSGWDVEMGAEVAAWLGAHDYDPRYGARHLQRNIERELLSQLAQAQGKRLGVEVRDGKLVVAELRRSETADVN